MVYDFFFFIFKFKYIPSYRESYYVRRDIHINDCCKKEMYKREIKVNNPGE